MSIKDLTATAVNMALTGKSILISGCHGCGKTEWVTNTFAPAFGLKKVVTFHPSHAADSGDITGLPDKIVREDGTVVTKFAPPDWMVNNEPVVLFIDEANRGLSIVQAALMELTANHRYNDIVLPEGSAVVAAINPEGSDYEVGHFDFAQKDRFWVSEFKPSVEDTLDYFALRGVNKRVIQYIKDHPSHLDFDHFTNKDLLTAALNTGMGVTPSCRSWEGYSRFMNLLEQKHGQSCYTDPNIRTQLIMGAEGLLGTSIAIGIQEYLTVLNEVLTAEKILSNNWSDEWDESIASMETPKCIEIIEDARRFFKSKEKDMTSNNDMAKQACDNLFRLVKQFRPDVMMLALTNVICPAVQAQSSDPSQEKWIKTVFKHSPELRKLCIEAITAA